MVKRLIASVVILLPLMYVSMGHMMWNWPLPAAFAENHVAMGLYQMLLTILVMVINQKFFISGFSGLIHRSPQYGYSGCHGVGGVVCLQHLCPVRHDGSADADGCGRSGGIYAFLLL